jgi:hypothetical protein
MRIKPGVDLRGLRPQMVIAALVAERLYATQGADADLMITSGREGTHMSGSLHYVGLAIDIRLPGSFTGQTSAVAKAKAKTMVADLIAHLGAQYDVVLEVDHIHIEFDPKDAKPAQYA